MLLEIARGDYSRERIQKSIGRGISAMDSRKHIWEKPELIIIARANPEEAVLAACSGLRQTAANVKHADCTIGASTCDLCETPTTS